MTADSTTPERYRGKPMLVIIDSYALSVIGMLSPEEDTRMRQVVKQVFGGDDDWRATVRRTMAWPSNVDAEILENWESYKRAANAQGIAVDPGPFARAFGDEFSKY
jgi:hypothetical protein